VRWRRGKVKEMVFAVVVGPASVRLTFINPSVFFVIPREFHVHLERGLYIQLQYLPVGRPPDPVRRLGWVGQWRFVDIHEPVGGGVMFSPDQRGKPGLYDRWLFLVLRVGPTLAYQRLPPDLLLP